MKELIDSYVTAVNCQQKAEDGVRLATIAAEAAQIEVMRAVAELARLGIPRPRLTFNHRTGRCEASIYGRHDGWGLCTSADTPRAPRPEGIKRARSESMTYTITEPCIGVKDASCVEVCPVDCIHSDDDQPQFWINPDECIDCGACEPVCPVSAIFPEDAVPAEWAHFTEANANYYRK